MPSGKQVLIDFLSRLALTEPSRVDAKDVTDEARACLLLRGSTADDAWGKVHAIRWAIEDVDGDVVRHGLAIGQCGPFLSDLLETIISTDSIPRHVLEAYPMLTQDDYTAATVCIWLIFLSLQWFAECSPVENYDPAERDRMISSLRMKLEAYRNDPDGFLGRDKA